MNKEIYYKILAWITMDILDNQGNGLTIRLGRGRYVDIFRTMDGDEIQVNHYADEEGEKELDGGGGVCMSDEHTIDDMHNELDPVDIDSIHKYIGDKADFIYELVHTY